MALGRRLFPAAAVVLIASVAVTAAIDLPVAAMGDPVVRNGLAVTVSEPRTATSFTVTGGETVSADHTRAFLLVRVTVSNRADTERPLPGAGTGDITLIAPAWQANNFGELADNCNQVYLDEPFTAGGVEYESYAANREAAAGRIAPRNTVGGWMAFRIEGPSPDGGFEPMVIVDDVGRWSLGDEWSG